MRVLLILFILDVVMALIGFGWISTAITRVALILFWVLLAFVIGTILFRLSRGRWWY